MLDPVAAFNKAIQKIKNDPIFDKILLERLRLFCDCYIDEGCPVEELLEAISSAILRLFPSTPFDHKLGFYTELHIEGLIMVIDSNLEVSEESLASYLKDSFRLRLNRNDWLIEEMIINMANIMGATIKGEEDIPTVNFLTALAAGELLVAIPPSEPISISLIPHLKILLFEFLQQVTLEHNEGDLYLYEHSFNGKLSIEFPQ